MYYTFPPSLLHLVCQLLSLLCQKSIRVNQAPFFYLSENLLVQSLVDKVCHIPSTYNALQYSNILLLQIVKSNQLSHDTYFVILQSPITNTCIKYLDVRLLSYICYHNLFIVKHEVFAYYYERLLSQLCNAHVQICLQCSDLHVQVNRQSWKQVKVDTLSHLHPTKWCTRTTIINLHTVDNRIFFINLPILGCWGKIWDMKYFCRKILKGLLK